ncbi:Serine hydroxymethyltransferase, cytosolic, partial [Bonamia ostreae]
IAVQLKRVDTEDFVSYSENVIKNAKKLANELIRRCFSVFGGGTDTHLFLWNCKKSGLSGNVLEKYYEKVGIFVSRNKIPGDKDESSVSGLRVGLAALTTRGMTERDIVVLADFLEEGFYNAKILAMEIGENELMDILKNGQINNIDAKFDSLNERVKTFANKFNAPGIL